MPSTHNLIPSFYHEQMPCAEELLPKRFSVILSKLDNRWDFKMGYVVTLLSIEDWCSLNGYRLDTVYPVTRAARSYEKTDLF